MLVVAGVGIWEVFTKAGTFTMWHMMAGIILVCLLSTCKATAAWSLQETFMLAMTWGLTLVTTLGVGLQKLASYDNADVFFFFVWAMISVAAYVGIAYTLRSHAPKDPLPDVVEESPSVEA